MKCKIKERFSKISVDFILRIICYVTLIQEYSTKHWHIIYFMTMTYLYSTLLFYIYPLSTTWSFYTLTIILTTMAIDSNAFRQGGSYIRDHIFDDIYFTNTELAYFEIRSKLVWSMSCVHSQQCKSFSYNTQRSFCQHFNIAFWAVSVLEINQSGWIHYDPPKAKGCEDLFKANYLSGVYTIYPDQFNGLTVQCEMAEYGGGWTRYDGTVNFHRSCEEYKTGFGNISGEFWFENDRIHSITTSAKYELRFDMSDWIGTRWYAVCKTFKVGDENSKFQLTIGNYSGNAGDSMAWHNGMKFSTMDRDNDKSGDHCARVGGGKGGWWYRDCDHANVNSLYGEDIGDTRGIEWESVLGTRKTTKTTRMMIIQHFQQ